MLKIKQGDVVTVIAGKDKGKQGKVMKLFSKQNRAIVERINLVKKHMRRRREDQQAGVVSIEAPIHVSNLKVFCKRCNQAARIGSMVLKDGSRSRFCKKCKEII